MAARIHMLSIEIDGHFHGGKPLRPWAARITGPCQKYGLAREFVEPLNEWRDARTTWSGRTYGVVANFPLREREMYEIGRCRGKSSKRYFAREFYWVESGEMEKRSPDDALAWAEGVDRPELAASPAVMLPVREDAAVAEVVGVGTPRAMGFVLVDGQRRYRLHEGRIYEVDEADFRRLVTVRHGAVAPINPMEALRWLAASSSAA